MAALDHGVGSIVTASGQAAIHLAISTLLSAGDHIVASRSLYGGTHNLFQYTLSRFGISTTFVDPRDFDAFTQAIQPNTKVIFGEVLGNPGLEVLDIPQLSKLAHDHGLPLMIDATFVTPYLCRPIDLGADIVVHSATKFLSGHGVVVGGVVVDGGTFDWRGKDKFPTLSQPYEGFHDLVFAEEFGPLAFITRARREGIRDFGACMAPMTAFQILQGLETLPLRMQRHVANDLGASTQFLVARLKTLACILNLSQSLCRQRRSHRQPPSLRLLRLHNQSEQPLTKAPSLQALKS